MKRQYYDDCGRFFASEHKYCKHMLAFDDKAAYPDAARHCKGAWEYRSLQPHGVGRTNSFGCSSFSYWIPMAEDFFSILKTECIYRHKPSTFREADDLIGRYIYFYVKFAFIEDSRNGGEN